MAKKAKANGTKANGAAAPTLHLPAGGAGDKRERAAVEDVVGALSDALECDSEFVRHILNQGQEDVAQYFKAGYSVEMALTETLVTAAMLAHAAQWDHRTLGRQVSEKFAVFYDACGRLGDAAHKPVDHWVKEGGRVVPLS